MNWHRSPELLDRLAAEYSLGTLGGGARRRFEAVMRQHAHVARAAAAWAERLQPLDARLMLADLRPALWQGIEQRAFDGAATHAPARGDGRASWWQRWFGPAPAAAMAFGVMVGLGLPVVRQTLQHEDFETQLPESYVGVLATPHGEPGLVVSSLRRGTRLDLKVIRPVVISPGQVLVLWTLDAKGVAQRVRALPPLRSNFVSMDLGVPAESALGRAVELAVSVEPANAVPDAPGSAFVYRGLCGKLWPVKAPASASG